MLNDIHFIEKQHIGIATLMRSASLNALTLNMIKSLQNKLQEWQQNDRIRAVIIKTDNEKVFCAGGDVRWLYDLGLLARPHPQQMEFFWHEYRLNYFINKFTKPYIVLMNGLTMGGGVGISLHGSHPVAGLNFSFAMPETGIGFFPDVGASYLLSRTPGFLGEYLGLTGYRLDARDALKCGLVKYLVDLKNTNEVIDRLCKINLADSSQSHFAVNACLQEMALSFNEDDFVRSTDSVFKILPQINNCFGHSNIEDIFFALQKDGSSWSQEVLKHLHQKSPLSLKVTLSQIAHARRMSLAECLQMDYCLVQHFMMGVDFYEGIRALLVDKDKSPNWCPNSLSRINNEQVSSYRQALDNKNLVL